MSRSIELWNVDIVGIHKGDPELTLLCLGPNLTFSLTEQARNDPELGPAHS